LDREKRKGNVDDLLTYNSCDTDMKNRRG
jgi:hypothetical protein